MREGDGGILNGDSDSLQEVVAEGGDVTTEDECKADEWEAGVWERGGKSERGVFNRGIDERGKGTNADTECDGDVFGGEKTVKGGEMGLGISAKVFACSDEVEKEEIFSMTDESWLTSRGEYERG